MEWRRSIEFLIEHFELVQTESFVGGRREQMRQYAYFDVI
jgi:hypothetical protein